MRTSNSAPCTRLTPSISSSTEHQSPQPQFGDEVATVVAKPGERQPVCRSEVGYAAQSRMPVQSNLVL
jgi:hypothetical protein